MKTIRFTFVMLIAALALTPLARAASATSVRALLITATSQKGAADPKLKDYEAVLQRNLPESSFRFVHEGQAPVAEGAHATIALTGGHSIVLDREKGSSAGIRVKVQWMKGGKEVNGGTFTLEPNTPLFLVTRGESDLSIVLLIAK